MSAVTCIASDVDPARISPEAVIHPGCRISGSQTSMGPGCVLGAEAPVTLENCQLARNVQLKGGFFSGAVFLDGATMGSGAHVRSGTLLEEEAGGAHTVGLKQTVLLPFVTLGSLINFCDILMAGGTSRQDHGEVGSSYIHFNYTPNQDKATASLIGDVPRGVLLGEKPVFLGGQGGLVGPSRIAYGTVIAAGGVCRRDVLDENQLHIPSVPAERTLPYERGVYKRIDRIVKNNLIYIGNIRALKAWYSTVRQSFIRDEFDQAVFDGAQRNLDSILAERIKRLGQFAGKTESFFQGSKDWKKLEAALGTSRDPEICAELLDELACADRSDYIAAIRSLSEGARSEASAWLQNIVDETSKIWT